MKTLNNYKIILLLCFTLGLAPFVPEPHIWGKLKWIAGGAKDMQAMDWFDTFLHGFPWLLMLRLIFVKLISRKTPQNE